MTHTTLKTVAAGLTALIVGSTAISAPAAAGGSISFTYATHNAKQARALQTGLELYGIVSKLKSGGNIKQVGLNNLAGLGQNGSDNLGIIYQKGNGNAATLQQNGNANSYGIFQFGKGSQAQVVQNGYGQSGATFQFGW
jgi:hypothetical protein